MSKVKNYIFETDFSFILELKKQNNSFFVTDNTIYKYYSDFFPKERTFLLPEGELIKTLASFSKVVETLIDKGVDRSSTIIAVGGGVVTDFAGFVASVYMRGIKSILVPTSLLGMIDASIGGKTAINFKGYKNIIGTFSHAAQVVICPGFLRTLSEKEWRNGFSELLKYAFIGNNELLELLQRNSIENLKQSPDAWIQSAINQKISIVSKDEKEAGLRKILNFGHTLGHAIERVDGLSHGEGVALGMLFVAKLSFREKLISEQDLDTIKTLIGKYKLPLEHEYKHNELFKAILADKKKNGTAIDMIVLESLGKALIKTYPIEDIQDLLYELC